MSRPHTPASAAASGAVAPAAYSGQRPLSGANLDLDHVIGTSRPTSALSHHTGGGELNGADRASLIRSAASQYSDGGHVLSPQRSGTLKKKASLKHATSVSKGPSRRSSFAASVRSLRQSERDPYEDAVESNVNGTGQLLADRFQAWRKVLKDLINYFRSLQKATESQLKSQQPPANLISVTSVPPQFLAQGGLGDAVNALQIYHKQALLEASKAREVENEVVLQLTGLRSDLQQKIKEIKSLSGDFKNSVEREQESTKKVHRALQESLGLVDSESAFAGKSDPFLIKLGVDRQIERQIEEENYLHRAYLNLEASGRELESIVVGEIQKAYTVLAGILNRDATNAFEAAAKLREGPLAMTKDFEWVQFVKSNRQMVDPDVSLRNAAHMVYPGQDHPAAIEIKSGMLERKSKYLKNYTPGWYILSPTHLHEFKSADRILHQSPVMSLYLPEQKLGSHSEPDSSSHKFMLKGRQSGSMHRGHSWVFRAETHDTMLAWYSDIKELTEKKGEARNEFVRRSHARSLSGNSLKAASINSSEADMAEDEADKAPFSSEQSVRGPASIPDGVPVVAGVGGAAVAGEFADDRSEAGWRPPASRPEPGGRFPSDVNLNRGQNVPLSPASVVSERDVVAAAAALPGADVPYQSTAQPQLDGQTAAAGAGPASYSVHSSAPASRIHLAAPQAVASAQPGSTYGEWMSPLDGVAAGGVVAGGQVGGEAGQYFNTEASQRQIGGEGSQYQINADTAQYQINADTAQRQINADGSQYQIKTDGSQYHVKTDGSPYQINADGSQYQIGSGAQRQIKTDASAYQTNADASAYHTSADASAYRTNADAQRQIGDIAQHQVNSGVVQHQISAASGVSAHRATVEDTERSLSRQRGLTESTQATTYFAPSTPGAATIDSNVTAPSVYSVNHDGEKGQLERLGTSKSVTTLSDLLIPGKFPDTADDVVTTATPQLVS
ncbi:hypothetical protein DV735_g2465, partial [Chaetothyriales sp. CBS 134920]